MGFNFFEKNRMITGGVAICCLIMVLLPEITVQAAKEAVSLWLNSVVPVLMPFFIAANFLKDTGLAGRISPVVYPFLMGMLSGYPMGAKTAGDYYREGRTDRTQLRWILSYSMVTGPAFLIGTAGHSFLGSHRMGIVLAVCHYASAGVNSLFYSRGAGSAVKGTGDSTQKDSYYNILTDAILESFRSVGIILAYIMIFMIAADLLQFSGILRLFDPQEAALIKGLFEMTVGCSSLSACPCSDLVKMTLASFIVTFGGLSVAGQSMSMLRGCGITFGELLLIKLSHALLCAIMTFSVGAFMIY